MVVAGLAFGERGGGRVIGREPCLCWRCKYRDLDEGTVGYDEQVLRLVG